MIKSFGGKCPKIDPTAFVADNATVIGDVTIGKNCSIWYGAVLRGDDGPIVIGDDTNVQDNSVVHSEECGLYIGRGVTIGHNAIVHGKSIGDDAMIGMGSISLSGSVIGDRCILGAGALLTQNKVIPNDSVLIGSPAKIMRDVTEADVEHTRVNAKVYVNLAKEHKTL